MKYEIYDLIGENAITSEDGQKLYDLICKELVTGHDVELSFNRVKVFASPFFNFGIGQLLKNVNYEKLSTHLHIVEINSVGKHICDKVIENAQKYYTDAAVKNSVDEVINQQNSDSWH